MKIICKIHNNNINKNNKNKNKIKSDKNKNNEKIKNIFDFNFISNFFFSFFHFRQKNLKKFKKFKLISKNNFFYCCQFCCFYRKSITF